MVILLSCFIYHYKLLKQNEEGMAFLDPKPQIFGNQRSLLEEKQVSTKMGILFHKKTHDAPRIKIVMPQ